MKNSLKTQAEKTKALKKAMVKGRKKGSYNKSALRKYESEIFSLKDTLGLSFYEIQLWLRTEHKLKVSRSTVSNYYYRNKGKKV